MKIEHIAMYVNDLEATKEFFITYLDETFEYEVLEINKVLPDETESLKIEKGKDNFVYTSDMAYASRKIRSFKDII